MQAAYPVNLFAEAPRVVGVKLRPFSLGHSLLLDAVGSPFVRGGLPTDADFAMVLMLCSVSFDKGREWVSKGRVPLRFRMVAFWLAVASRAYGDRQYTKLTEYLENYSTTPERWSPDSGAGGKMPKNQWQFVAHAVLCSDYADASGIWDIPLGMAICYTYAKAELEGEADVINEQESDIMGIAI